MKLWLLCPVDEALPPWMPWYDKAFGFVVQAFDEFAARQLAASDAGDEAYGQPNPWLDPAMASCVELVAGSEEAVIIRDYAAA